MFKYAFIWLQETIKEKQDLSNWFKIQIYKKKCLSYHNFNCRIACNERFDKVWLPNAQMTIKRILYGGEVESVKQTSEQPCEQGWRRKICETNQSGVLNLVNVNNPRQCARSPVGQASGELANSNKVWLPNAQMTIKRILYGGEVESVKQTSEQPCEQGWRRKICETNQSGVLNLVNVNNPRQCARSPVGQASGELANSNKVWLPNAQMTIK